MRYLTLFFLLFTFSANSQKLPNKQKISFWAPNNLNIGGRGDEWDSKFQAYNRATSLFYASPYCQPCAKAHQALEWIEERNDIKLQMIFATSANGDDNNKLVATHLLSLAGQPEQKTLKQAVHDWFDQKQKNYLNWAQNYPVESKSTVLAQLEEQRNWCTMAGVRGTPTIFINGRKLPSNYQTEDIRYFI